MKEFEDNDAQPDVKFLVLKALLTLYTIITLPIYFFIQQPWKIWTARGTIWAKHTREADPYSPVERVIKTPSSLENISTLDGLFRTSVQKYGKKKCHGVRKVLAETEEPDKTGKVFRKLRLGDYQWYTYLDAAKSVEALSKGLLSMGLKEKRAIVIFAETRREWILTFHACLRINIPVSTLYATLGEDGIIHGINETEVSTIVTSQSLLPKLKKIAYKIPAVKNIIYMEDLRQADINGFPSHVSIFKLSEIEERGRKYENEVKQRSPGPNDLALIMYTSGSTGTPKGVLITHKNLMTSIIGLSDPLQEWNESDVCLAYLPMAHIYQLVMEFLQLHMGFEMAYSSPYTLTDKSTGLAAGTKGDISLIKPTIFSGVPLMVDRMRKGVNEAMAAKGPVASAFFNYAIEYKTYWWERGFRSPIMDKLLFRKIRELLGGRVKYIVCGGAHLSYDTELFVRASFNAKLALAYAATESAGSGCVLSTKDYNTTRVGPPIPGCSLKLVDWEEGGYKATDKPHPRGEITLGGDCISLGYFKNQKLTEEAYEEVDGKRWFCTGDIGEMLPDGSFKIIDRKKDLQKLQRGEYVSLGKIEADMKTSPHVDNICVISSSSHDYLAALVIPNEQQLRILAMKLGKPDLNFPQLCQDPDLVKAFTDLFKAHGKKSGLQNPEIPQKIKLCHEEWLPDNGLVTAALKIRRKPIENFYKDAINQMFGVSS